MSGGIRIPRPYSNSAASTRPWSSRRAATSRLSARRPRREAVGKRPSARWPDRATTPCRIRRPCRPAGRLEALPSHATAIGGLVRGVLCSRRLHTVDLWIGRLDDSASEVDRVHRYAAGACAISSKVVAHGRGGRSVLHPAVLFLIVTTAVEAQLGQALWPPR